MVPLKSTSDPMESADDQTTITTEKLNQIIRQPLDVSSLALDESSLFSDLKVNNGFPPVCVWTEICKHER